MSVVQVSNLSFAFGDKELYENASFALYSGERMGVVGQNGVGKSTLIQILLGQLTPDGGQILWQNGVRLGYIDQHASIAQSETLIDYLRSAFSCLYETERELQALYARMAAGEAGQSETHRAANLQEALEKGDFYAIEEKIARVATGLGLAAIGLARQMGTLSGGQRAKAILGKLLLSQPDVLLLDEPTNFLDVDHINWLKEYLVDFPGSCLIVSHDFEFLERVTTCILDIEFRAISKYHGKYSSFLRQKAERRANYIRQYNAQQRETERLEAYIAKNKARASTARMAKSREKRLERMEKLAPPSLLPKPDIRFAHTPLLTQHALVVRDLLVGYDAPLLPKLRFSVGGGKKVVVTGFNGIGKSTLFKTLAGVLPPLGGAFDFALGTALGYFEQDLRWEDGQRTPLQILAETYPALSPKQHRSALARCGISAKQVTQPVASLSGGEQNKLKLCRLCLTPHNFLLLDEPTNHLDAEARDSLRRAILDFPGAVLIVCHEAAFYREWADSVIDIERLLY